MTRIEEDEIQASIADLCHALKLLAVVAKSTAYETLREDAAGVERMSRDVEQVCNLADKALQRLVRDTGTLKGYPEARTGDLAGE